MEFATTMGVVMMRFPSRKIVERLRKEYPAGTRVELIQMFDVQAPPIGTLGTVKGVDDVDSIMVAWDKVLLAGYFYNGKNKQATTERSTNTSPRIKPSRERLD